jgi:hypothetical protein
MVFASRNLKTSFLMVRSLTVLMLLFAQLPAQPDSLLEDYSEVLIDESVIPEQDTYEISTVIDINNCPEAGIADIPILSRRQIRSIQNRRPFVNFKDLVAIIGPDTLKLIRPYITITSAVPRFKIQYRTRISGSLQQSRGIRSGYYRGSPFDLYQRFDLRFRSWLSAGFLSQKDAGEKEIIDHLSGFLGVSLMDDRVKIILGDFRISAGTGLMLSNPYGMGGETMNIRPPSGGLTDMRPFVSAHESYGLRGIGIKINIHRLRTFTFLSFKAHDPQVNQANGIIYGIRETGLHRSDGEMLNRDLLQAFSYGGGVSFEISGKPEFGSGVAMIRTIFTPPIQFDLTSRTLSDIRRNFYHFSGTRLEGLTFFTRMKSDRTYLTGEAAFSRPGGYAFQASGGIIQKVCRFGIVFWFLNPAFTSLFGRSSGSRASFPGNNEGFRFIAVHRPDSRLTFRLSWTMEKNLYRTISELFPGARRQIVLLIKVRPVWRTSLFLRYQHDRSGDGSLLQKLRLNFENRLMPDLRLRTRIDFSSDRNWQGRIGYSAFQDIDWKFLPGIRLIARVSFFHTWNYDLRLYEFENDVPGVMRTVPNYGSGSKWYLILQITPLEPLMVWIKIRQYEQDDVTCIGSGNDTIDGNTKTDLRIQFGVRF